MPIEFKKDVNGNIDHQIRLNDATFIGTVEGACMLYEIGYISADEAMRDIREVRFLHNQALDILTNTKSDYPAKD